MEVRLFDKDVYAGDPHPMFTWLRANAPVHRDPETGVWALTRHADVVWAERQPHLFSNAPGSRPRSDPQPSMIDADDPFHGDQRRIVARGFTPKQMVRYEAHVHDVVERLVGRALGLGRFDVVREIARPLPMTLIGELLGADPADFEQLQHWSDQMIRGADGPENITDDVVTAAFAWGGWITEVVAQRRRDPGDDLVSTLVGADVGGRPLDDDHVTGNALLLLVGGNETTRNVITGGLHALLSNPSQWERLVADPDLVPGAVEECLRWVSPILNMNRTTTAEVEIRGTTIPAGSSVLLEYASANRDEDVFDDPFELDVGRQPNPHVAFGFGPHFCLGSSLARLEIRATLDALVRRAPGLRLADPHATPAHGASTFVRGMTTLEVIAP